MTDLGGLRIGDAERETAVAALGEHFAQGRLDSEEYDERVGRVWSARVRSDLPPLFDDLPGGAPEPLRVAAAPSWAAGPSPSYGPGPGMVPDDWRRRGRVAREKASAAPTWLVVVAAVILVPIVIGGVVSMAPFIVAGLAVWFFLAGPGRSGSCGRRHHGRR